MIRRSALILVALAMALFACTPQRKPSDAPTGGQTAPTGYAQPRDPCSGISATLTRRLGLKDPSRQGYDRFQQDPSQPDDPLVAYDDVGCEWTVANPGRSPDGRPNQMTASISYSVIDSHRASAGQVAALVLDQSRQRFGKDKRFDVVRNAGTPLAGRDGYNVYVHEKSATGMGALSEAAVRVENAVIVVRFAGADLRVDRSKPVGLQLTTRPVDERRLRPTVLSLLPAALEHLIGSASASAPADTEAEGRRFAQQMVDALNAGDTGTIKDQECGDNNNGIGGQRSVELPKAGQRVEVRLDPSEIVSDDHFTGADLTGTVDGKQISAGRISIFREDAGWCLYTLYLL